MVNTTLVDHPTPIVKRILANIPSASSFCGEIFLEKANPDQNLNFDFVGTHCGVYHNGDRVDCMLEEFSIFLNQQSQNIFTGKITSAYSFTDFEIRLIYLNDGQNILWEVTKIGDGLFYFPMKEIL